ncbi:RNA polymerase II elongation factor ell1 [Neolecta irregularis DAH-3]|uniref:RNA polymerase II elongation factor ell1 n=1 Tax=Neolecta irregularis (strain DAH-3) TaxID=1198029 RepID=A0A1U7LUG3_NEOID|nr:RNA polymerase II elongation factor ell1 [Neolecta irregularis DAH-3]|eukprot:OLL26182.1 RNA polymerase II elongation factor ell1 [Neolecta irregularis DAH-3]
MSAAYCRPSAPLSLFQPSLDAEDTGSSQDNLQCMYFRLSEDVLAALLDSKASPDLEIVFGETAAFSVGNKSFALTVQEESGTTELYRHSDIETGRLDMAGNVSHKLSVNREIDYNEYLILRSKSGEVSKSRTEKQSTLVDAANSDPLSRSAKNKTHLPQRPPTAVAASVTAKPRPANIEKNQLASKSQVASVLTPATSPIPLRSQIVHLLALKPVREDYIAEKTQPSSPNRIRSILTEVGDRLQNDVWGLKDQFWPEVKSHNWPHYTDSQRTEVTNRANAILDRLGISDNSTERSRNPVTQLKGRASAQPATPPLTAEHSTAGSLNGSCISPDLSSSSVLPKKTGGGIFTGRKTTIKKRKAEEDTTSKPKRSRIEDEITLKSSQKPAPRKDNTKTTILNNPKIKSAEYVVDSDAESTLEQDNFSDRSRSGSLTSKNKKPIRTRMQLTNRRPSSLNPPDSSNGIKANKRAAPHPSPAFPSHSDDSPVSMSEQSSTSYTTNELNDMARQYRSLFPEYQKLHNRVTALTRNDVNDSGVDVEKLLRRLLKMHDQLRGWKEILVRVSKGLDL